MDAADTRKGDIADPQRVLGAVGDVNDLPLQHVERLLQRVIVRVEDHIDLVVDHEELAHERAVALVDQHLYPDSRVRQQG